VFEGEMGGKGKGGGSGKVMEKERNSTVMGLM